MKTIADTIVQVLVNAGVKRIYGIVGDSLNNMVDPFAAMVKSNGFM